LAPKTDEWRGKLARTRFAGTGKFTESWRDWSDLQSPAYRCMSRRQKFDHAVFDHADLSNCMFFDADFSQASFLGADLSSADFKRSTFVGAKYDCFTKFPSDLDRTAAGMINVDGDCANP